MNKDFYAVEIDIGGEIKSYNFNIFENGYGLVCKIYCDARVATIDADLNFVEGNMPKAWIEPAIEKLKTLLV